MIILHKFKIFKLQFYIYMLSVVDYIFWRCVLKNSCRFDYYLLIADTSGCFHYSYVNNIQNWGKIARSIYIYLQYRFVYFK